MLAAAGQIPESVAVVTIGAPFDPSHVRHLLAPAVAEIESAEEAEVNLAGRRFRVRKQFLEDLARHAPAERIGQLRKALLVFHSMTLRLYADQKHWPLERVVVKLQHGKVHAADCAECETREGRVDRIERELDLGGPLDDTQRRRLLEIADRCPVHRTLHSEVVIRTRLAPSPARI